MRALRFSRRPQGGIGGECYGGCQTIGIPRIRAVIETLRCLKKYGQRLDLEIAREMRVPLATVRRQLVDLAAKREIVMCDVTRFDNGKRIDAWQCRVSGYVPPPAPGRKPTPKT